MSPGPMRRGFAALARAGGAAADGRSPPRCSPPAAPPAPPPARARVGGCHGAGASVAIGRAIGHTTISPYSPMRLTVCVMVSCATATPARATPPNTVSTISSTAWVERKEVLSGTDRKRSTRSVIEPLVAQELVRRGALEREDRLLAVADREDRARILRRCPGRRRTPRSARRSPATAPGWCPAPRRSAHGRCRRRACRAPTARCPAAAAGRRSSGSGPRSPAAPPPPCAGCSAAARRR